MLPDSAVGTSVGEPLLRPLQAALEALQGNALCRVEAGARAACACCARAAVHPADGRQPRCYMQHGREDVPMWIRGMH